MAYPLQQSSTALNVVFGPVVLSSDHISAATGKTLTVTISKNGAAFASPSGAVSEVGNGYYEIAGNSTDNNTLGALVINASGTGCDPFNDVFPVVAYNSGDGVHLGLSSLPNASPAASGGLPTVGTGAGQLNPNGSGAVPASTLNGTTPPANWNSESIDGSGRVLLQPAQAGVTIPTVTTVGSVTGAVGSVTGAVGSVAGAVGSVAGNVGGNVVGSTGSVTGAVGSVTGNVGGIAGTTLPATVPSLAQIQGGLPTDASIATDVETGMTAQGYTTTRAGYLDTLNGLVGAIWAALTSGLTTVGSIGKLLSAFLFDGSGFVKSNAQVVADKTGYSASVTNLPADYLSSTEQTQLASASTAAATVATNLDAKVSTRSTYAGTDTAGTTTLLTRLPQAVLFDGSGNAKSTPQTDVTLDMTQAVPTTNTAQTLGDALNAARAQGFGKWVLSGTTLTLYAPDGTTSVRAFTLDSSTTPTQRT